jgi:tetratricopeptide (TPR) repeat protein
MPRSVSIYPDRKQTIEDSLKRNGFLTQGDFAAHIGKAVSTVNNFFTAKKVAISTFEEICEALGLDKREIQKPLESSQDKAVKETSEIIPTLYNPEKWVGRSQLIEKLLNQLQQNTRIVWLTGLSGIGKTTLGECIAVKAWESDPFFQWLHLEISASQLPDFATGVREILSQLGEKDLDPQEMNDPKRLSDRLLQKLQSSFYWLQIDALEKLISANEFIDSYWLIFLESCLNTNHFSSRLLLTSQVLPNSLINWCDRFSNIWHQETLKGLENEESEQYFSKNGIVIDESNQDILTGISQTYEGHPLVLQVITGEILQVYQGDVTTYWQVNQAEFEQVSRELKSSRLTETEYNEQLARRVRERVKKSLEQLPEKAIALLCRSAVYRRPVLKKFWLDLMTEYSPQEQIEAYRVLGDRALIETEKNLIRLHNLVRDIAYGWLRENEIIWKAAELKAAELWLNDYQPEEDAENLEKVRGYLEALYHYCDAEESNKLSNLFEHKLSLYQNKTIYSLLFQWGYVQDLLKLCEYIKDRVSKNVRINCWNEIGICHDFLGNYDKAAKAYNNSVKTARNFNDYLGMRAASSNLGLTLYHKSKFDDSVAILLHNLAVAQKLGDLSGQGLALSTLGVVFLEIGYFQKSIDISEESLKIYKKVHDLSQTNILLLNIGSAYCHLRNFRKAKKYLQDALNLSRKDKNLYGEGSALISLGAMYVQLNKYYQAMNYLKKGFKILEKIGHTRGQEIALSNIGICLFYLGKYNEAITNLQNALKFADEIDDYVGLAFVYRHLAEIYYTKKQIKFAQQHCKQALQIATELGIPLEQPCQELLSKIEEAENC